ncbi:hypothetical protein [Arthrobacter sp. NPDC090010]|uniref:hypothetical protein n=1 Tax=Arthrobacter sp. NPDC090010 TaxID=3363942 RepID=UPI00382E319E
MSIDIDRAHAFMTSHARLLDRHRFDLALNIGEAERSRNGIINSLEAYRNSDGGFGWGLEPDLRAPESQPGGAQHAWEAIADTGIAAPETSGPLLEWLEKVALPDGGLPFALPIEDPTACAPFWVQADSGKSSLQITAGITTHALRSARVDESILSHPWLKGSVAYCFNAIAAITEAPFAYVLSAALQFLDAASDTHPQAQALLTELFRFVPHTGALPVLGGADGESLHLLDYAPEPGRPIRALLGPDAVEADLDRAQSAQDADGGWSADFPSYSDAAAMEWRGYLTIRTASLLKLNGR